VIVLVVGVIGGGAAAYRWTQTQYYLGIAGGDVAIYRGIPQSIGPLALSDVVERTALVGDQLPGFVQTRLGQTIPASSLADARARVARLVTDTASTDSTTPTSTPAPTA